MYTFHFYAASHGDSYRAEVARAAALIPIFVTEFGTVTYTGGGVQAGHLRRRRRLQQPQRAQPVRGVPEEPHQHPGQLPDQLIRPG
jgi:hypothetical protein